MLDGKAVGGVILKIDKITNHMSMTLEHVLTIFKEKQGDFLSLLPPLFWIILSSNVFQPSFPQPSLNFNYSPFKCYFSTHCVENLRELLIKRIKYF